MFKRPPLVSARWEWWLGIGTGVAAGAIMSEIFIPGFFPQLNNEARIFLISCVSIPVGAAGFFVGHLIDLGNAARKRDTKRHKDSDDSC